MIRKFVLSTVAIVTLTGTAFAADLPSRRAPPVFVPPPVPLFSWTGFYVGGQVGFGFGRDRINYATTGGNVGDFNVGNPTGIIGGLHVGYLLSTQSLPVFGPLASSLSGVPFIGGVGGTGGVFGIEGDVDGSDYRSAQVIGPPALTATTHKSDIGGSVRGRLGIAVDRALFYATGGVAFAEFRNVYNNNAITDGFADDSHTRIGYTVGGGIEYAITTQFSLRAEYRYTDYGHFTDFTGPIAFNNAVRQNRAQVGFSYKFDNPVAAVPVVARY